MSEKKNHSLNNLRAMSTKRSSTDDDNKDDNEKEEEDEDNVDKKRQQTRPLAGSSAALMEKFGLERKSIFNFTFITNAAGEVRVKRQNEEGSGMDLS
jgi:hypothetical protein